LQVQSFAARPDAPCEGHPAWWRLATESYQVISTADIKYRQLIPDILRRSWKR
jgi:hypothetical protein